MPNYRELKNRTRISTTLDNSVLQKLKEYSFSSGVPITRIFDRAIVAYLESMSNSQK